jgi:hypothetical protein
LTLLSMDFFFPQFCNISKIWRLFSKNIS